MTSTSSLVRSLLIYSICLPVAVFLGYLIAQPTDFSTIVGMGLVFFCLALPLLLRWYHFTLVASWNMVAVLFFVPGRPFLWLSMAWFGFVISIIQYILNRRHTFLSAPMITRPLILLFIVVVVTAKLTGGIGLNIFGSETQGGKRYILMVSSIVAYFALTSQTIPAQRANLYVALYFLGAITAGLGELARFVPSALHFIFWVFPVTELSYMMIVDPMAGAGMMARLGGLAIASSSCFWVMLARYGIRDSVSFRQPIRFFILVALVGLTLLGGYRSGLIMMMMTFFLLFCLEGMVQSRSLPIYVLAGILVMSLLIPFVDRLPLTMQRSLSFLPLPVDPLARQSAEATTEWRLDMWKRVLPEIPDHLLLGKGYGINAREAAAVAAASADAQQAMVGTQLAGDYHNGPLSVILPFGLPGVAAIGWFLVSGFRVLWRNYRFGIPEHKKLNTFLLAYYTAQVVLFLFVFGSLYSDFIKFAGLIGLSVSLNGGVRKPVFVPQPKIRYKAFQDQPAPGIRRPADAVT